MASLCSIPWEHRHRSLDVCQTWSLTLRLRLQDKKIGFFHRRTGGCVSICCLCSALGVVVFRELSLWLLQCYGTQEFKAPPSPLATRARLSRGSNCKNQGTRRKTWVSDMCETSLTCVIGAGYCDRESEDDIYQGGKKSSGEKKWYLLALR